MAGEFVPTPLHRALDQVTTLKVEVQTLARQVDGDLVLPASELGARLRTMDQQLTALTALLRQLATDQAPRR